MLLHCSIILFKVLYIFNKYDHYYRLFRNYIACFNYESFKAKCWLSESTVTAKIYLFAESGKFYFPLGLRKWATKHISVSEPIGILRMDQALVTKGTIWIEWGYLNSPGPSGPIIIHRGPNFSFSWAVYSNFLFHRCPCVSYLGSITNCLVLITSFKF